MASEVALERKRQILDAAVRVFAREGFHATRVSDIADEADVAYGLVYHYFPSKEKVLDEIFTERWSLLLVAIEEADQSSEDPRDKLRSVARFIIDSYRYDPDLMKVIIVEVTRAANSFGRTHLDQIDAAFRLIERIITDGQRSGAFRTEVDPYFASMTFYGVIEQLLTGWIFGLLPSGEAEFETADDRVVGMVCDGLESR
ncbi:MAG: TetR/AcrR family transcriptional regulator [Solirubrobacterales bacterium]|jgi:TetR/AcrR family fatty acid metabolism transcriptional regulator